MLRVERRDRARRGCRDGLAVRRVDHVAGGEHARQVRARGAAVDGDGALGGELQLLVEEVRARVVADGDEEAFDRERTLLARDGVLEDDALDLLAARDVDHLRVPDELDLGVLERAVLHDLGCAQRVLAVDHVDLLREAREEGGLLHRAVAAADDRDGLLAEEEAVARGAPGDAVAAEAVLRG